MLWVWERVWGRRGGGVWVSVLGEVGTASSAISTLLDRATWDTGQHNPEGFYDGFHSCGDSWLINIRVGMGMGLKLGIGGRAIGHTWEGCMHNWHMGYGVEAGYVSTYHLHPSPEPGPAPDTIISRVTGQDYMGYWTALP